MIIGAILNNSATAALSGSYNGSAMMHFYSMKDAVTWAQIQSENFAVGSSNLYSLCTVINTDTGERRWWYNGGEQTA